MVWSRAPRAGPDAGGTRMTSLRGLDLNLLLVFEALHETRSVSRAGQRLGLSQSATSHALARLR